MYILIEAVLYFDPQAQAAAARCIRCGREIDAEAAVCPYCERRRRI